MNRNSIIFTFALNFFILLFSLPILRNGSPQVHMAMVIFEPFIIIYLIYKIFIKTSNIQTSLVFINGIAFALFVLLWTLDFTVLVPTFVPPTATHIIPTPVTPNPK